MSETLKQHPKNGGSRLCEPYIFLFPFLVFFLIYFQKNLIGRTMRNETIHGEGLDIGPLLVACRVRFTLNYCQSISCLVQYSNNCCSEKKLIWIREVLFGLLSLIAKIHSISWLIRCLVWKQDLCIVCGWTLMLWNNLYRQYRPSVGGPRAAYHLSLNDQQDLPACLGI